MLDRYSSNQTLLFQVGGRACVIEKGFAVISPELASTLLSNKTALTALATRYRDRLMAAPESMIRSDEREKLAAFATEVFIVSQHRCWASVHHIMVCSRRPLPERKPGLRSRHRRGRLRVCWPRSSNASSKTKNAFVWARSLPSTPDA
jgi:hypothetical protein